MDDVTHTAKSVCTVARYSLPSPPSLSMYIGKIQLRENIGLAAETSLQVSVGLLTHILKLEEQWQRNKT